MLRHLLILAFCLITVQLYAANVSLTAQGIHISADSMGEFTMGFPSLEKKAGGELKAIEKQVNGNKATLKYEGGATLELELKNGTELSFKGQKFAGLIKGVRIETLIDFNYSNGGHWAIGGKDADFPKEKPAKAHLFQGSAKVLVLTNFENKTLTFTIPDGSFNQLQDNREWGWKTFCWWFSAPVSGDSPAGTIKIEQGAGAGGTKKVLVVDAFGQDAQAEYPGKVKDEAELKADVEADKAYYGKLTPPAGDAFGGLPGSGEKFGLKKTGFFHVEPKGERWFLVDPDGNAFFHLGVCSFGPGEDYTYVKGRENIYAWLPKYDSEFKSAFHPNQYWSKDTLSFLLTNTIKKFGAYDANEFEARMIERVRKFGFNSGGAFSGIPKEKRDAAQFPYVGHLPMGGYGDEPLHMIPGIRQTPDPFEPKNAEVLDKSFAKLANSKDDALLIGYFLTNEPNFEDMTRVVPTLNGKHACKVRLITLLKEKYKTPEDFNKAWGTTCENFEKATETGLPVKTPAASEDMKAYAELFWDAYYKVISENFRKHDPNHMLIGNRWQPHTANNEILCRAAGKYMDVISVNYYTYALDKDYLNRVHDWSGKKPMFLSEFYWSAPKESGLPGGGKDVETQQERGLAYRNYVEQSAANGYVLGIEWFTLIDQSRTGRFFDKYNGENGNTGLFACTDRPWVKMIDEMIKTNYDIYKVELGERAPFVFDNPRFQLTGGGKKNTLMPRAPGAIKLNGQLVNWPGVPPELISKKQISEGLAGETEAAFRATWDEKNLYVMVTVSDATPMKNPKTDKSIWMGDGVELFIGSEKLDEPGALQFNDRHILLGAGAEQGKGENGASEQYCFVKAPEAYKAELSVVPGADGKGYVLSAAIPWEALKIKPAIGTEFLFDLGVDDSENGESRARQLMWNGNGKNSGDRSLWGRAKLGQ